MTALDPILARALDQSSVPTCITDNELELPGPEIVYVNEAYCRMMNTTRDHVIGLTPRIMQGPLTDRVVLRSLKNTLRRGESFMGETFNYRLDGSPFINSWRIDPIRNAAGEVTHYSSAQRDVTDNRSFEALAQGTRHIDDLLRSILASEEDPASAMDTLASGVARAAHQVLFGVGRLSVHISHPFGESTESLTTLSPTLVVDLRPANPTVSGAIEVELTDEEAKVADRNTLEMLAIRASTAIDALAGAILDRKVVGEFERQLGSRDLPSVSGFEVAHRYQPTFDSIDISGDWLDVIAHRDRAAFVIGDVAGHGVEAAVAMTRVRAATEMALHTELPVEAMMAELNTFCFDHGIFSTLMVVRPAGDALEVVCAGHIPPIVVSGGEARLGDVDPGPALGSIRSATYGSTRIPMDDLRVIALVTDGLVERRTASIDEGLDVICAAIGDGTGDLEAIADRVIEASRDPSHHDDTALMLIAPVSTVGD